MADKPETVIEIKELTSSDKSLTFTFDSLKPDTKTSSNGSLSSPSTEVIRRRIADKRKLVKKAINTVLGIENEYLERVLEDQLEGREKSYCRLLLSRCRRDREREQLKDRLSKLVTETQQIAVSTLLEDDLLDLATIGKDKSTSTTTSASTKSKHGDVTPISSWVLHTLMEEKLKERELRESADYWKYINGVVAIILPIITSVAEYFIIKALDPGSCS